MTDLIEFIKNLPTKTDDQIAHLLATVHRPDKRRHIEVEYKRRADMRQEERRLQDQERQNKRDKSEKQFRIWLVLLGVVLGSASTVLIKVFLDK